MSQDAIIWASLPIPAFVIDDQDRIADVNSAGEGFMNASNRVLKGAGIWELLQLDPPIADAFARSRSNGTPLFVNDVDVGANGRGPLHCAIQVSALQGRPGHMLMLLSPRELAGRMTRNHSVKSAAQSAIGLAEMLAHEIKNPLAGITGAAQLLSMNASREDIELTDLIVAESHRIVKLLEQVEQFGNLTEPARQPVNLHDILDRARRSAQLSFAAHMTITEDYDPSLPMAWGDPDQLAQVIANLLRNASEAAKKSGGNIHLRTFFEHSFRLRRNDGSGSSLPLQIEVSDDGPGLPPAIRDEIFDPFVSGRENGSGLGLALVSKIISEHGGWIAVDSVPGRTTFRLSLPRVPRDAEKPEQPGV
jgi:two-component system nitrogen regulation sensor histidine kinase GlnL